ncbi:MAG: SH3 domain-containing protein [Lachnospiraceae bacterium]|nr:SH3 domain-containing protein [Lachnospiraceae bacterium]
MRKQRKKQVWLQLAAVFCVLCLFWLVPVKADAAEVVGGHAVAPLTAAMAAKEDMNVRSGPGVNYPVMGRVQGGQAVNVCGLSDNGWYQVIYGTQIGYMSRSLLKQIPVDDAMLAALAQQVVVVKQNSAQAAAGQAAAPAAQASAAAAAQPAPVQQAVVPGSGNIIFVGDSRTGQMGNAVGNTAANPGVAFLSCYGGQVEWLASDAFKREIEPLLIPGSVVVINYGVNDLSDFNEYITVINHYNRKWREKGVITYFATVGPVGPNEYNKTNWSVEHFNNQLSGRLDGSIGRINLYAYLVGSGCNIQADGMHYQPETYARMFTFLMQSLGR